jgi:TonB family protein
MHLRPLLLFAALAAATPLAAQDALASRWHTVLTGDDGTSVAIDSTSVRPTGPSTFVVRTAVRFAGPMQLESGRTVDREIDVEELDCGAGTSRGVVAGLYDDTALVRAGALSTAWAPVADARKPVFDATCAFLLTSSPVGTAEQYELSGVEEQPELANRPVVAAALSREFPRDLRQVGATGTVTVRFRVLTDGRVDPATVEVLATTDPAFDTPARNVAVVMRFRPARVGGHAVPVWVTLPVSFRLQN